MGVAGNRRGQDMRQEFNLSGISFRPVKEIGGLRPQGVCTLEKEPTNQVDPNAIKVLWDGHWIGYVPGKKSKFSKVQDTILGLMENGEKFQVEVVGYAYCEGNGKNKTFNDDHKGVLGAVKLVLCTDGDESVRVHNGKEYKRISTVSKSFFPDGRDALDSWMINRFSSFAEYENWMTLAADKGTAMHDALERFYRSGGQDFDARHLPDNFGDWRAAHKVEPIAYEETIYDDELLISGRFDMEAMVDGVHTVLDWKSSSAVRLSHKLQACWYAYHKTRVDGAPATRAMVVAFGTRGAPAVWIGDPQQVLDGYTVISLLARAAVGCARM